MSGVSIAILDYGMGNLRSVAKALEHVGARPELTNDPPRVREADGVVLPGVGAMPRAMEAVRRLRDASGTQFDPGVVTTFVRLFDAGAVLPLD